MKQTFKCNSTTAIVKTSKGLVKGYEQKGLSIFKGIPYAKAKRFHAPEPVEKWEGVFDAASYGFVCPLLSNERPSGELYVPHRYWPMDEDCLNLNVWTPGLDDGKRPVLVWLHGGGYEAGSSIEQAAYDGANMTRLGDAVVVSVNHRLNILGYFDLSDFGEEYINSANAGTDDIIAALQWVHDNIASFGGNPANDRLPDWQPCGADCENTMVIGEACGVRQNFDHALIPAVTQCMAPVIAKQMAQGDAKIQH